MKEKIEPNTIKKNASLSKTQPDDLREPAPLFQTNGEAFKILVIQQKMIGDVLVSSIICENLKITYPHAEIHYVANRFTLPVIENNPYIDQVIVFEEEYQQSKIQFLKFLRRIRKSNYKLVVDAYGKIESNLISLFSRASIKISWKKIHTQWIYTHGLDRLKHSKSTAGLAIEDRLNLLSPINIPNQLKHKPKIYLTEKEKQVAKIKLEQFNINCHEPLFMIGVLGSEDIKTYPLNKMAKVLDFLVKKTNAQLIFNYIPKQENTAREVYLNCKKTTQNKIFFELIPQSLREFMALTYHCDALIGNEGGAVNMAKALNIPTFTIFSPWVNPIEWASFEDGKKNASVHLKEIQPQWYQNISFKELKPKSLSLYAKFDEAGVIRSLDKFLQFRKN